MHSGLCLWCRQPDTQVDRRAPGLTLLDSFPAASLPTLPMLLLKRCAAALRSKPEDRAGEDILVCETDNDDWMLVAEARD